MSKRMKDERLDYFNGLVDRFPQTINGDYLRELLQALKVEREYAERTCEWWREWDEDGSHWEASCGADGLQRGTYCSCCGGLIVENNDE